MAKNQEYWLKSDGTFYAVGKTIKLISLANTLKMMVDAEQENKTSDCEAGIIAARDRPYKGDIAKQMVAFLKKYKASFKLDDFAEFYARVERPVETTYKDYIVYKQPFNSQGSTPLQTLNILENFDLQSMGHNSTDYPADFFEHR